MSGESSQEAEAILFADIVGSTSLYEKMGNAEAKAVVDLVLARISEVVSHHSGLIVKYIGDEAMARFQDPDKAFTAAIAMQEAMVNDIESRDLGLKVGMDYGPVIREGNDVFGNTVNVAARMASVAAGGQIITTQDLLDNVSEEHRELGRVFDRAPVRGKAEPIDLVTILWEDDVTTIGENISNQTREPRESPRDTLQLTADGDEYIVSAVGAFTLGRGMNCDLALPNVGLASRQHATIEFKRDSFVITDQSTNGTYVRTADGNLVYLRREEMQLLGQGVICLGSAFEESEDFHIYYRT